ncbi:HEAT repeat domain-containing protein [Roseibacillus persicicus]|uniref:HEAT repeat domain-containing protein n=1 Tax=Roseibacillus persicicus TaxID=454148 RepID=A0A918WPD2_9BACT|nr:HEAT repeat domain-containing protein [Roseibacillus persicicus]GHC68032.1 hypothetical protein GCM10007100_40150 [Roseibacillus persicicus]
MKTKLKAFALIFTCLSGLVVVRFYGAQLGMIGSLIEMQSPGLIADSSWLRLLETDPENDGLNSYSVLADRNSNVAIPIALKHVKSDDDYLWLNAASYLGDCNRPESIPYLIKALRHTAWRSLDERVGCLEVLTGQNYGRDFDGWRTWYLSGQPEFVPDWESSLGYSPRL